MAEKGSVLFLTYDGLEDHIAQAQVLPYVLGLAARGWRFTIVSHEKRRAPRMDVETRLRDAGVRWIRLRYQAGSPARTIPAHLLAELAAGVVSSGRGRPSLVHARSYLPAASAATLAAVLGARFIFDMRGFWIDEKVDSGLWQQGGLYSVGKALEKPLFARADGIVSLTHAGKRVLSSWPALHRSPIAVIPTCVDLTRHQFAALADAPLTIGYLGSLGERYPIDAMVRVVARIRQQRPDARFSILTLSDPAPAREAARRGGIPDAALHVGGVPHREIPAQLPAMHATISLVKPSFASQGSCPTKFGESLAVGRPVVVNVGVGDCADIARTHGVGSVTDLSPASLDQAADDLLRLIDDPSTPARCRQVAESTFSLERALDAYEELYAEVLGRTSSPRSRAGNPLTREAEASVGEVHAH